MRRQFVMAMLVAAAIVAETVPASGQTDVDDSLAVEELAERYAPVVMVKAQDGPCDPDGEPFEPAPVEIVLDNPEVFLRQVGNGDPVAMRWNRGRSYSSRPSAPRSPFSCSSASSANTVASGLFDLGRQPYDSLRLSTYHPGGLVVARVDAVSVRE